MRKLSKILALVLVLMMSFAVLSAFSFTTSAATPTTLYLTPNANWKTQGARFAAYFFGNGEKWVSMTDSNGDGVYEVTVPSGYPNVIFCRMNPSATANNWNNKWNQTADLVIPTSGADHYTVKEGTWDKGGGTWSTLNSTCTHTNLSAAATCTTAQTCLGCGDPVVSALGHSYNTAHLCTRCNEQATFTVAGSGAHLGTEWDTTNAANDMTYDAATGTYTKVYTNVAKGSYNLKVARDHDWGTAYPSADKAYTVATAGSTVTVTLKGTTVTVKVEVPHVCSFVDGKCSCGEVDPSFTVVGTLDELKAALLNGGNILLNADIESSEIIVIGQPTVLVGGGHTITSTAARAINISGADGVTIKNLTVVASGERAFNVIQGATNVVIENVTATAANYAVNVAGSAAGAVVTVKDCDLTGLNVINLAASDLTVTVTGTTLVCNDQTDVEAYGAIAINPEVTGSVSATDIEYVVSGDSSNIVNSAANVSIVVDDGVEVANMVAIIVYGNYVYSYPTLEAAIAKAKEGDTIVLLSSIVIDEDMVIENVTIEASSDIYPAIRVINGATLTMNNVTMTTGDYAVVLGASDGSSAGNLVINSGRYHGTITVVSVTKGKLTVNGGEFSVTPYEGNYAYLLNCIDANYRDGSAVIEVLGGVFHNWNPANNAAEGVNTNFVPNGYHSVEVEGVYTVGAHAWVDATFEAPKTCTGCGATEGEALVAVATADGDPYATLAEALENGSEIVLLTNIKLDSALVLEGSYMIDLNGFTLSYESTVQGEAMITNKGSLVINDSSEAKTGVINYNYVGAADSSYGKGNYTISNRGELTVNGGKITIANLRQHAKYPIDNNSTSSDAILVINGGHLYNYNTSAIRMFCNSTTYKNSVTINGGLIEGYSAIWMQNPGSKTVNGDLTITGGEIRTTAAAYVNGTAALKDVSSCLYPTIDADGGAWSESSFVNLAGGTFNENVNLYYDAPASVTISDEAIFNGNLWFVCNHVWVDATCTAPKTCSVCSATEGEALGHTWVDADCDTPKTCSACGETEGEALGHTWVDATCTAPKTCSVCSTTEGEVLEHTYVDGVCSACGAEEPHTHKDTGLDAKCDECGEYFVPASPFKLEMYQHNKKGTYYFKGSMSGYYFATTSMNSLTGAVDVYAEEVDGGYYLYFLNGTTKNYLYVQISGSYTNIKYGSTKAVWAFNTTFGTFTTVVNGTTYYMGTYSTYVTISASKFSYVTTSNVDVSQFVVRPVSLVDHVCTEFTTKVTNPTCTAQGYTTKTCTACGVATKVDYVDALDHDLVDVEALAPTCTTAGYTAHKDCSRCTYTEGKETVAALGHKFFAGVCTVCEAADPDYNAYLLNFSQWPEFAKETYADGDLFKYNDIFTLIMGKNSRVDGSEKTWDDFSGTLRFSFGGKTPTGAVPSKNALQITVDGAYTIKIWYVAGGDGRYFALMDENGAVLSETTKETVKNTQYYSELVIPAAGTYYFGVPGDNNYIFQIELVKHEHTYGEGVVTAPTCTEAGYTTYTCACGHSYTDSEVAALGHTEEVVAGKDATCTETGLTEGKHCSVCNEVLVAQEEVAALGHTEEVVAGKDATCTEAGLTEGKKCTVCGEVTVAQEEIPALGHDLVNHTETLPTCTETGVTEGEECTRCDYKTGLEEIPALGHEYAEGQCTRCGEKDPEWVEPQPPVDGGDDSTQEPTEEPSLLEKVWAFLVRIFTWVVEFFKGLFVKA